MFSRWWDCKSGCMSLGCRCLEWSQTYSFHQARMSCLWLHFLTWPDLHWFPSLLTNSMPTSRYSPIPWFLDATIPQFLDPQYFYPFSVSGPSNPYSSSSPSTPSSPSVLPLLQSFHSLSTSSYTSPCLTTLSIFSCPSTPVLPQLPVRPVYRSHPILPVFPPLPVILLLAAPSISRSPIFLYL